MAKFDVESAYRNVPVPTFLLGKKWRGNYLIASFIFASIADLLEWILKHNYRVKFLLHYLDDFHTLGPPNLPVCQNNLDFCIRLFGDRGIPLHPDNLEGPSTCTLIVLGIELDSLALQARLPRNKFERIIALLDTWSSKQYCMRKVLEDHRQSPTRLKIHSSGAYLFTAYDQLIISVPARWPTDKA